MSLDPQALSCPLPLAGGDRVLLAHGEGARLTRRLVRDLMLAAFDNDLLRPLGDAARLPPCGESLAMTTDSYVVSPLFFPGGDIGRLAVYGTVNDLAVSGAQPLYLSLAMIIEEGLELDVLRRIVASIAEAARRCGVMVVTGDTKVVPRGAADGLFVNTTGIGRLRPGIRPGPEFIRPGDQILISGTIGDHGMAVLAAREGLDVAADLASDAAPLHELAAALLDSEVDVHFLRDPTRGGVSAVLHEAARGSGLALVVDEEALPVAEPVRGMCEILGLDPLYVANEGKLLAIVAQEHGARALDILRGHVLGRRAALIGTVTQTGAPEALVRTALRGSLRVLDEPAGAPLPRIC